MTTTVSTRQSTAMRIAVVSLVFLLSAACDDDDGNETGEDSDTTDSDRDIPSDDETIIVVGNSVMAWNRGSGNSIGDVIAQELGTGVYSAAVSGAPFFAGEEGENIPDQYVSDDWDWVVLGGGANDLNDECGCSAECSDLMNSIISPDGESGAMPDFVRQVVDDGADVIVMGYYNVSENALWGFAECNDAVDDMSTRMSRMADLYGNVWFVDAAGVISPEDEDAYAFDNAHPSILGSTLIGEAIADRIRSVEQ